MNAPQPPVRVGQAARPPPPVRPPVRPKVSARFTAAALSGHSALGLVFGALIHLICLTGTLSVFADELKLIEQPAPAAGALHAGALEHAVAWTSSRIPAGATLYATAPVTPRQRLTLTAFGGGGEHAWIADADGRPVPARTPWTDFVTRLHMTLTAPAPWGSLLVGVGGAALLAIVFSGVLSHPRIFRDAFRLRLSGSRRLREAELHNRLSVWGLPFHVAVTLTGAFFGLINLTATTTAALAFHGDVARVYAPLSAPVVTPDPRPAPPADLGAMVAHARAAVPGSRLYYVGLERTGTRGAAYTVEVTAHGRLPRGEQFYFNSAGREIGRGRFATGSLGRQAYSAAAQVHFGVFGGLPVRIAYGVFGAALTYICATGTTIWLTRRRDGGRPAPRLERAWTCWTWGVPLLLILAAVASPWASPVSVFWLGLAPLLLGGQLVPLRGRAL